MSDTACNNCGGSGYVDVGNDTPYPCRFCDNALPPKSALSSVPETPPQPGLGNPSDYPDFGKWAAAVVESTAHPEREAGASASPEEPAGTHPICRKCGWKDCICAPPAISGTTPVKRFSFAMFDGYAHMAERENGEYVEYKAFASLRSRLSETEKVVEATGALLYAIQGEFSHYSAAVQMHYALTAAAYDILAQSKAIDAARAPHNRESE